MTKKDPIKHVILLMMENHSFDQMLGCFSEVYPNLDGIKVGSERYNADSEGLKYFQKTCSETQVNPSPMHEHVNVMAQLADGANSGFVKDYETSLDITSPDALQNIMGYYPMGFLPALHALAKDFTVCDKWFSSLPGPTWPNRMFGLSGTSNGSVFMPENKKHFEMLFNQKQTTIFDLLGEKHSWNIYFYDFPASLLLQNQRKPFNLSKYKKIDEFFETAKGNPADFPEFSFIEPKYFGGDENDDHPPHNIFKAQKLIADVYNSIRSNKELWESTLLVIYYDEHGGFYDHVVPPKCVAPDDKISEYAFTQFGVRVPAILVSPWVSRKCLNTQFDHTSLLKYLLDKWDLGSLGARTAAANSISEAICETQPRTDTISFIRVPYSDLMPKDPTLEIEANSSHHDSLQLLAASLSMDFSSESDEALADSIAEVSTMASFYVRAKAWCGKQLICLGNYFAKDLNSVRNTKIAFVIDSANKLLKKK